MKRKSIIFLVLLFVNESFSQTNKDNVGAKQRAELISIMIRIADPVLTALSKNELKKQMPVEAHPTSKDRPQFTYLEAFGRLIAGMSPWLASPEKGKEHLLQEKYAQLIRQCIKNATDPSAADYMNFNKGKQPLVDAAFFAEALLRAPAQLWTPLDQQTKINVIAALKSSRVIQPYNSNWLLFSATVEAALLKFDGSCNDSVINHAIRKHFEWYKGDGTYGDGPSFHWDYYNSFVIQPMLLEVLHTQVEAGYKLQSTYDTVLKRAVRYAVIQERLIAVDGTYPAIGRSLAYRFGAFHLLSKVALMKKLPSEVKPQQVRAALYAMIKKQINAPGTFDKNGWLTIGFFGHQPEIGEGYISTGSLYLCSQAFLILGLPSSDEFWKGKDEDWTSKKIWKGEKVAIDHATDN